MKDLLIKFINWLGLAYWAEIVTDYPRCTYYFGPFLTRDEALATQDGYVEDLQREEAQGIQVTVKRCKPNNLTIFDENTVINFGSSRVVVIN